MHNYRYDAFISYRHITHDKSIAIKLQKLLEGYKPPKSGNYENTNRIKRLFRDESELPTSGDLGADIQEALEQSAFLIVICSEETAKSQWCMQEIEYFKQLHDGNCNHILTMLVHGNPREVFPEALCYETRIITNQDGDTSKQTVEVEPLAANVVANNTNESIKLLKTEFLRIAAPILGCSYDDLFKRHQRRFIRKVVSGALAIIASLLLFSTYAIYNTNTIQTQSNQILQKQKELEETNNELNQSKTEIENVNTQLQKKNEELQQQIQETTKQKNIADEQTAKALQNQVIAEENYNLANEQRVLAETNAAEAKRQEGIATENFLLANQQKVLADLSAKEAKRQEEIAQTNESKAIENLNIATRQRNNALRSQSRFLASLANEKVAAGDTMTAMMLALAGMPTDLKNPERPLEKSTVDALRNAIYDFDPAYGDTTKGFIYKNILNQSNVVKICSGLSADRVYTISPDKICLWETQSGKLIDQRMLNNDHNNFITVFEQDNSILVISNYEANTYSATLIKKDTNKIIQKATYKDLLNYLVTDQADITMFINKNLEPIILDLASGSELQQLGMKSTMAKYELNQVVLLGDISKDNQRIALFNEDKSKIYELSVESGNLIDSFDAGNVSQVYYLTDKSIVYITDSNNEYKLYHYKKGSLDYITTGGNFNRFLNNDTFIFSDHGLDGKTTINLTDLKTYKTKKVTIDAEYLWTITLSPDERYAAFSEENTTCSYLFDLSNLENNYKIDTGTEDYLKYTTNVVFSPDSRYLIYYIPIDSSPIMLYETATQGYIGSISRIRGDQTYDVSFLSNQQLILTYGSYRMPYVIDIETPEQVNYFYGDVWAKGYFDNNQGTSIDSNVNGRIKLYASKSGKLENEFDYNLDLEKCFFDLSLSERIFVDFYGKQAIFQNNDNSIKITWEDAIIGSHINRDGSRFLLWGSNHLAIYDAKTYKEKILDNPIADTIQGVYFSPDNTSVIIFYKKKILYLNMKTGKIMREIDTSDHPIQYVKQCREGSLFITYSNASNIISIYEGSSGKLQNTITLMDDVWEAKINGDGTKLLITLNNDTVYIYSLSDVKEMLQVPYPIVYGDFINNCDINYDGTKVLITCAKSGMIFVWDIIYDDQKLTEIGKDMLNGRSLSEEEKEKYFLSEE